MWSSNSTVRVIHWRNKYVYPSKDICKTCSIFFCNRKECLENNVENRVRLKPRSRVGGWLLWELHSWGCEGMGPSHHSGREEGGGKNAHLWNEVEWDWVMWSMRERWKVSFLKFQAGLPGWCGIAFAALMGRTSWGGDSRQQGTRRSGTRMASPLVLLCIQGQEQG